MSLYPENKPYSVYRHLKPCGEVFYIGIASTDKRPFEKIGRNKFWKKLVNKHPNYEVQILTTELTKEEACELEIILISWYGRRDLGEGSLVNLTDGGESTYGRVMEDWQRNKLSEDRKGKSLGKNNPNYGNKWSEKSKKRMSEIKKKQYSSGEVVHNINNSIKGAKALKKLYKKYPKKKEEMAKKVSKAISKYNYLKINIISGEILEEYESFMELKKAHPDVGRTVVNSVCNGHKVSYLGYIWRYRCKETHEVLVPTLHSNKGFDKYYEVEDRRYLKITQASKGEGLSYSTISNRFTSNNYPNYKIKKINHEFLAQ